MCIIITSLANFIETRKQCDDANKVRQVDSVQEFMFKGSDNKAF